MFKMANGAREFCQPLQVDKLVPEMASGTTTDGADQGRRSHPDQPRAEAFRKRRWSVAQLLATHGLLLFGILLVIAFWITLPGSFLSMQTLRAILGSSVVVAFLALAEMMVIASGNYDMSVGYMIGLIHLLVMSALVYAHLPWGIVVVGAVALGGFIGLINGLLIERAKIDAFIATLGVGTILYGLGAWLTNGAQVVGRVPKGFSNINDLRVLGVPLPALLLAAVVAVIWIAFEYLPLGRKMYAVGSNRRAAELNGIRASRLVLYAFISGGCLVGIAGVLLAARLQVGQSAVGPEFLLPAFVGALLGGTTVRPGRVNALGTIIAVLVLAIGISGLQQFGGGFFVEPIFQGSSLVLSVGLAGYAARRRRR